MGVEESFGCIQGMKSCVLNQFNTIKINIEDYKKLSNEIDRYIDSYKRLIFGEGNKGKYWFMIRHNRGYCSDEPEIEMHFGYQCIPQVYAIKDKNIWWFSELRCGYHIDELFETYEEAEKHLEKSLLNEIELTEKKISFLKEKKNFNRKAQKESEETKRYEKCGCEK